jgi:signal transduction histidine kinase
MAAGVMAMQPKLRAATAALVERAPVRWIVLSLVTVAAVWTAASSYREIDRELTAVALMRRETVAQLTATILAEKFERLTEVAVSLATRVRFRELVAAGKWAEAIELMRAAQHALPHIERLILTDTGGTLRADLPAIPGARGVNLASHEWFQGVRRDRRPYISSAYTRVVVPRLNIFSVAVPVNNAHGKVTGFLVVQIGVKHLLEWVETVNLGPEGFLYIVDSKGQAAFHSRHPEREDMADLSATPVVEKLRRGGRGVEIAFDPTEGEDSIVAHAAVPGYGWGVVTRQPARASFGLAARDRQLRQLMTGYALILLLGSTAIFLTLRIAIARRRAEDDRRMKAELERQVAERTTELNAANKELEAFSYSVSHDLRAPLRSIDGFSQAVIEDCADRLDDQARDHLNRVRAATQHMGQLIDDLIKLARVARAEMQRETVDLSALAGEVLAALQKSEPKRRVEYSIEPGLTAEGDARLLRVMLDNLLGNAWKFTGKRPRAHIEFGAQPQETGGPAYYVRDNGAGFDMTYAGKLFGAFQRLHTLSEFPGTGVGLATVQRIVHRHGGRVWAEGAVGKGTTFYFTL